MSDDPYRNQFQPQQFQQQQPQQTNHFGQPIEHDPVHKVVHPPGTLICDFCEDKINPGDEGLGCLYGKGGIGEQSGRQMIVPSKDIPNGIFDVHYNCLPDFIIEHLPDVASQVYELMAERMAGEVETEDLFCANCDEKLDPETFE